MINPSDEFERNFVSQVKGEQPQIGGVVPPSSTEPKAPVDKKWLVVIGLGVVLVVAFVILNLVIGKETAIQSIAVGAWGCDDGTEMKYNEDGTYEWVSSIEALISETGTYKAKDLELTTTRTARHINDSLESTETITSSFSITAYGESSVAFLNIATNEKYTCMRIPND